MVLARKAILYTLLIHLVVLGAMFFIPVSDEIPASETFAEVAMSDQNEALNPPAQSFENQLRESVAAKVANRRANAQSQASSEEKSSSDGGANEAEIAAQVEAELQALEEAEFERRAAVEKEFDTAGEAEVIRQNVGDTFEKWDAQYDGLVTVKYSLDGRSGRDLDVPGYTCVGGAQVGVHILVDATGRVVEAKLAGEDLESCFGQAALRSALRARFSADASAPRRQSGMLTYIFVAQ